MQGRAGPQGVVGMQGPSGNPGTSGPAGANGLNGALGQNGPVGNIGPQGAGARTALPFFNNFFPRTPTLTVFHCTPPCRRLLHPRV